MGVFLGPPRCRVCITIVSIFLAHPQIDVNLQDDEGWTPFLWACNIGHASAARVLLKDSRAKVNKPSKEAYTPLWHAASKGRLDIVRHWIASGRRMNLGEPGSERTDAIAAAKRGVNNHQKEVALLLEKFEKNRAKIRHEVRVELGWYDERASEVFAVVVFLCDNLLRIARCCRKRNRTARFFRIARRLHLELQGLLCHRVVGSAKDVIRRRTARRLSPGEEILLFSLSFSVFSQEQKGKERKGRNQGRMGETEFVFNKR